MRPCYVDSQFADGRSGVNPFVPKGPQDPPIARTFPVFSQVCSVNVRGRDVPNKQ
jgi:hypothetical protein